MHLTDFTDVVVERYGLKLLRSEHFARFCQGPREVIAVVLEIDVGILRGVKAATLTVAEPFVLGNCGIELASRELIAMHIVLQQLRVVVGHLFKMRHHPSLIY